MVRNGNRAAVYQDKVFTYVYWFPVRTPKYESAFKVLDSQDHLKMYQTLYGLGFDPELTQPGARTRFLDGNAS
jgi:hypothetical protein